MKSHLLILQRLSQCLEGLGVEFRKFVEEKYPMIGESDLAWHDRTTSSDKTDAGDAMMRLSARRVAPGESIDCESGKSMHRHGFEALPVCHRGENARQSLGQHCLAGSRRAAEKNVVTAGGRDLECSFGEWLAVNLGKVGRGRQLLCARAAARGVGAGPNTLQATLEINL